MAVPVFAGIALVVIMHQEHRKSLGQCERLSVSKYMNFVGILQSVASINLVLLPIIEEKASGVKEFLRISCRHSNWNLVTFYVLEVLLNFGIFMAVLSLAWSLSMSKHFDMICMVLLMMLYVLSNIAFMFMLSVMFNDGKG